MINRLLILLIGIAFVGCSGDNEEIRKTYFPNGVTEAEMTYIDGIKNGPFIYYSEEGMKWKEGVFLNDTLDGLLLNYTLNGIDTSRTAYYEDGEMVEQIDYTGAVTKIKMDYKKKLITVYDKSGAIDSTIQMK